MAANKKSCSDYYDRIIFIADLAEAERKEIEQHVAGCRECGRHLQEVGMIMNSLKSNPQSLEHVDEALLARYTTYLAYSAEPDYDDQKLTQSEIKSVKQHIKACRICDKKVERYLLEFREIEQHLQAEIPDEVRVGKSPADQMVEKVSRSIIAAKNTSLQKLRSPAPKSYPLAFGVFAAIVLMIWVGPLFRADETYFELAHVDGAAGSLLTRGNDTAINQAASELQERDYSGAASILENFIVSNPDAPQLYYAHYLLGIARLSRAGSEFLGRFRTYDRGEVDMSIQNLKTSLVLNDHSEVKEDVYWYLVKAYLMKNEVGEAQEMLTTIIGMRGRRFKDAKEMDKEIQSILKSARE